MWHERLVVVKVIAPDLDGTAAKADTAFARQAGPMLRRHHARLGDAIDVLLGLPEGSDPLLKYQSHHNEGCLGGGHRVLVPTSLVDKSRREFHVAGTSNIINFRGQRKRCG